MLYLSDCSRVASCNEFSIKTAKRYKVEDHLLPPVYPEHHICIRREEGYIIDTHTDCCTVKDQVTHKNFKNHNVTKEKKRHREKKNLHHVKNPAATGFKGAMNQSAAVFIYCPPPPRCRPGCFCNLHRVGHQPNLAINQGPKIKRPLALSLVPTACRLFSLVRVLRKFAPGGETSGFL